MTVLVLVKEVAGLNCTSPSCYNSELYQFFKYHIYHSPRSFLKEDGSPMYPQFYYAYFFQQNEIKYVTIWWSPFTWHKDIMGKANSRKKIKYQYLKVEDYYFVIITDKEFQDQDLLTPCSSCLLDIKLLPKHVDMFMTDHLIRKLINTIRIIIGISLNGKSNTILTS